MTPKTMIRCLSLTVLSAFLFATNASADKLDDILSDGMTMIAVIHEMPFAREVADRVAFFHEGVIHEIGAAKDLINNPQKKRTQEFLGNIL